MTWRSAGAEGRWPQGMVDVSPWLMAFAGLEPVADAPGRACHADNIGQAVRDCIMPGKHASLPRDRRPLRTMARGRWMRGGYRSIFPLDKGLFGYRVACIRATDQGRVDQVQDISLVLNGLDAMQAVTDRPRVDGSGPSPTTPARCSSPSTTPASGWTRRVWRGSSSRASRPSPRAWGWRSAARSSRRTAAGCGPPRTTGRAPPCTASCPPLTGSSTSEAITPCRGGRHDGACRLHARDAPDRWS
jgi:hypothetical protein